MSHSWWAQVTSFCRGRPFFVLPLTVCLLVFFMQQGFVAAVESRSATDAVKETIDQILVILDDGELKKSEHSNERIAALEKVLAKRFDYEEMGKRTLGLEWKKLNADQQKAFLELFQHFPLMIYAGNADRYSSKQVEYIKERHKGKFAEVQTRVISEKLEVPLAYRLMRNSGTWRIYDVVIDGVSLVKNFHGQFSRIMKASGFSGLLERLRSKTAKTGVK